jgi:hypothetical protein
MYIMREFLHSKVGRIIISILWGLGLATIFRKTCRNNRCIVINSPNKEFIEKNTFNYEGSDKCYKYEPEIKNCKEIK